jgi:hypothetical protein
VLRGTLRALCAEPEIVEIRRDQGEGTECNPGSQMGNPGRAPTVRTRRRASLTPAAYGGCRRDRCRRGLGCRHRRAHASYRHDSRRGRPPKRKPARRCAKASSLRRSDSAAQPVTRSLVASQGNSRWCSHCREIVIPGHRRRRRPRDDERGIAERYQAAGNKRKPPVKRTLANRACCLRLDSARRTTRRSGSPMTIYRVSLH